MLLTGQSVLWTQTTVPYLLTFLARSVDLIEFKGFQITQYNINRIHLVYRKPNHSLIGLTVLYLNNSSKKSNSRSQQVTYYYDLPKIKTNSHPRILNRSKLLKKRVAALHDVMYSAAVIMKDCATGTHLQTRRAVPMYISHEVKHVLNRNTNKGSRVFLTPPQLLVTSIPAA